MIRRSFLFALITVSAFTFGCASSAPDNEGSTDDEAALLGGRAGAVYTLSNAADGNAVVVYRRAADGSLQRAASYETTGKGSGDGLGSQGAVTLSTDGRWLLAVNAGSDELSVFAVSGESLYLVDVVASGGKRPISATEHAGLVYVLNAGGGTEASGIAGFRMRTNGTLAPIAGSNRALSAAAVGPAQISFSPSGRALVVTEKMTDKIDEFRVDASGRAGVATVHASSGKTPFGFAITQRGQVVVSDAVGGAAGAGTASSYQLGYTSGLTAISSKIGTGEAAPCWVVLAKSDRYAYVSNTASDSISRYDVGQDGSLSLEEGAARAGETGAGSKPIDMAVSKNDRFLYVLNTGNATVSGFRIGSNGALTSAGTISGLPATAVGLAAR